MRPPATGPVQRGQRCSLCRNWSNAPLYRCGHGVARATLPVWGHDGTQCANFKARQ